MLLHHWQRQGVIGPLEIAENLTSEALLRNVNRYRVYTDVQLASTIKKIIASVKAHSSASSVLPVRLIVIDSIAAPFRGLPLTEMKARNRMLSSIVQDLKLLARSYGIAVSFHLYIRIYMFILVSKVVSLTVWSFGFIYIILTYETGFHISDDRC